MRLRPNQQLSGSDAHFMGLALRQARLAQERGEVPVGAVLVDGAGQVLAQAGNSVIGQHDPTAHAEVLVLRQAGQAGHNYRLEHTTLYVTLEPCAMCAGALLNARVGRLVFGAAEPKTGAVQSVHSVLDDARNTHQIPHASGVLADECRALLQDFFRQRRNEHKASATPLRDDCLRPPIDGLVLPAGWGQQFYADVCPAMLGLRIHAVDCGPVDSRSAVLFVHDWLGWSEGFAPAMHALALRGVRAVTLDLAGCGLSDKPKKAAVHNLELHTGTVWALLKRWKLERVLLAAPAAAVDLGRAVLAQAAQNDVDMTLVQIPSPHTIAADRSSLIYPGRGHKAVWAAAQAGLLAGLSGPERLQIEQIRLQAPEQQAESLAYRLSRS